MESDIPSWLRALIVFALISGVFFRFYNIDRKVFWEDEIFGLVHTLGHTESDFVRSAPRLATAKDVQAFFHLPSPADDRLARTVGSLAAEDPQHPPVYYVLAHLWAQLAGTSTGTIRTLSAIFGVLALPCMYWLVLELFGVPITAWMATALMAASPFFILYSQEAREYTLWTVAVILLSGLFLRALRTRSWAWWAAHSSVAALSLYVYPFSALVLLCQGLFASASPQTRCRNVLLPFLLSCTLAAACFGPWAFVTRQSAGFAKGTATLLSVAMSPRDLTIAFTRDVRGLFFDIGTTHAGPLGSTAVNALFAALLAGLILWSFYLLIRNTRFAQWGFVILALCLPAVPLIAHDIFLGGELVRQARYFVPLYLGIEIAVAYSIYCLLDSEVRRRRLTAMPITFSLVLVGIASSAIGSQAETWWSKDFERSRNVAAVVNRSHRPLVVSDYRSTRILGLAYYLDPRVNVRLNVSCDQCSVPGSHQFDLINDGASYSDIYLLGPSDSLLQEARRQSQAHGYRPRYHIIGVGIAPHTGSALEMFGAI